MSDELHSRCDTAADQIRFRITEPLDDDALERLRVVERLLGYLGRRDPTTLRYAFYFESLDVGILGALVESLARDPTADTDWD